MGGNNMNILTRWLLYRKMSATDYYNADTMKRYLISNILQPGDLVLIKATGISPILSKLIGFFQVLINKGGTYHKTYSHIAIVDNDVNFIMESTWPKAHRGEMLPEDMDFIEIWRLNDGDILTSSLDGQIKKRTQVILDYMTTRMGLYYDWLELLTFGLFNRKNADVCSEIVGRGILISGIIPTKDGADNTFISPNEIVDSGIAKKVWPV